MDNESARIADLNDEYSGYAEFVEQYGQFAVLVNGRTAYYAGDLDSVVEHVQNRTCEGCERYCEDTSSAAYGTPLCEACTDARSEAMSEYADSMAWG